jgi:hypothetical protein
MGLRMLENSRDKPAEAQLVLRPNSSLKGKQALKTILYNIIVTIFIKLIVFYFDPYGRENCFNHTYFTKPCHH